jgi:hypothetical protein
MRAHEDIDIPTLDEVERDVRLWLAKLDNNPRERHNPPYYVDLILIPLMAEYDRRDRLIKKLLEEVEEYYEGGRA